MRYPILDQAALRQIPPEDLVELEQGVRNGQRVDSLVYSIGLKLKKRYEAAIEQPEGSEARKAADRRDLEIGEKLIAWAQQYHLTHPYNELTVKGENA